ncbi:MAG: bifunctional glutamate N-acetyltransferase/amino-acid acetyltransferase ArgJ [Clostridia bacterium]|nr:bifunctional glutamate N-acetyltransferase/amino-acid acetyltransferase ArgJ [Clostridia bacterium]
MLKNIQQLAGGVTAPKGFTAAGVCAGLKKAKKDLALIVSETVAAAAAVYTRNLVQAAPLKVTRENLNSGHARAIVVNSGNANACTGEQGYQDAREMAAVTARAVGCEPWQVVVASTGVIGVNLPMDKIKEGIKKAASNLTVQGSSEAAAAIMTTDTFLKEIAIQLPLGGTLVTIGGIAKGSGMIHPNMGTMLCFLTTDAAIEAHELERMLKAVVDRTFNMVTVDGDTSTNDMVVVLANGLADNEPFTIEEQALFQAALEHVCRQLARMIARDGEGATKLLTVLVQGAATEIDARQVALAVAGSNLVKSAIFGCDANWGRILCAAGYSGAAIDPERVAIYLESVAGCEQVAAAGQPLPFNEDKAKAILREEEVIIKVNLNQGNAEATAWGCDLTYDYVKINASYRS